MGWGGVGWGGSRIKHAMGFLACMAWDLDSGQEIRAHVFPRRPAANRKPLAAASAECQPQPLTHAAP
jgi:hypothetical protein